MISRRASLIPEPFKTPATKILATLSKPSALLVLERNRASTMRQVGTSLDPPHLRSAIMGLTLRFRTSLIKFKTSLRKKPSMMALLKRPTPSLLKHLKFRTIFKMSLRKRIILPWKNLKFKTSLRRFRTYLRKLLRVLLLMRLNPPLSKYLQFRMISKMLLK